MNKQEAIEYIVKRIEIFFEAHPEIKMGKFIDSMIAIYHMARHTDPKDIRAIAILIYEWESENQPFREHAEEIMDNLLRDVLEQRW